MRLYVGLLIGMWAVSVAARADTAPMDAAAVAARMGAVDQFIAAEMHRQKVPGLAIGIVSHGQVIAAKGYGEANVELHAPVTSASVFESASVGKQFTAVVVMLLVERGKLGLDDSVTKYFTDAPPAWREITVRNLLTHTSGIPDFESLWADAHSTHEVFDYRRDYTDEQLAKIAYALPLQFRPGTRWNYSNTGYVLLGILIRKVSGEFYGNLLRDRVFKPLGMKSARVISEADIVPNRTAGYRLIDGNLANQEWVSPSLNSTADGSLYLSIADFVAWDQGLRAHAILEPQSWAQIYTPVTLESGKSFPYGFGWQVDEWQGKPWYHHSGSWQGFRTYISRYLAQDLTVVVLINLGDAFPRRFVDGVTRTLDPNWVQIEPTVPIADRNPEVIARVRTLLGAAAQGKLSEDDFPFDRADFTALSQAYAQLLKPLGPVTKLELVDRRALGDDEAYSYLASYSGHHTVRVQLQLSAERRVVEFGVQPE
ncbi:MAG: beta-lactamase family protein [Proteobacteria bacterium]|nr:beta-lactamase family protein [Pseudomonadota bacterium]